MRAFLVVSLVLLAGCAAPVAPHASAPAGGTWPVATVTTDFGNITFALFPNETPKTYANFAALVERDFFENSRFDRVIQHFVVQGGASYNASQAAAPTEPIEPADDLYFSSGSVGIARDTSPDSGSSVFFFCEYPEPYLRDPDPTQSAEGYALGRYTVFGQVVRGMDVVREIAAQPTNAPGADDTPKTPIIIHAIHLSNISVEPGWRDLYPLKTYAPTLDPPYRVKLESARALRANGAPQYLEWFVENTASRSLENGLAVAMRVTGPHGTANAVALPPLATDSNVFPAAHVFDATGRYTLSLVETDLAEPRTLATVGVDVTP
ncbi:MAG: peptidylprolyl isomerase [Thermoplasmatota archaeon]